MNNRLCPYLAAAFLSSAPGMLLAQDYDYHPYISDAITVSLGAMRSSNSFSIKADSPSGIGEDIDFDKRLGVSDTSNFFNGQIKWKFGSERKWSLSGQYFSSQAKGNAVLKEDVEWDDLTFQQGTYAEAGVSIAVTRLFVGRSLVRNEQHDFGLGIGLHNLDLSAYIEGEVIINDETTGVQRAEVSGNQPLPNLGGWYNFSPAKRWLVHGRVDWISASIGDYDGALWNVSAGINYQAWRNVGFDLSWQYFNLDLNVDKTEWRGGAEMTYSGPVLGMTFNW